MVRRDDRCLWAVGSGACVVLGTGTGVFASNHVEKVKDDVAVTVGAMHVMALRNDGSLWTWGSNLFGQLGDGTTASRYEPVHIMDDVAFVSAHSTISTAVTTDNDLWFWGHDRLLVFSHDARGMQSYYLPQLFEIHELTPPELIEILESEITSISVGGGGSQSFIMIAFSDGSLLSWGENSNGQLGDGTGVSFRSFVKTKDDIVSVAGSEDTVLAITGDGSLWAWGNNENGAVGDDSTTNRPIPVMIMTPNPQQITDTDPADNEEIGYSNDSTHDELEEDDHNDEFLEQEQSESNVSEEASERLNLETVLLVAGVVFIAILLIAILIVAYFILKQKR